MYAPWPSRAQTQLRARYPFREVFDAAPLIAKLRVIKSAAEIAAIQHATAVSVEAQRAAWKRVAAGEYEYQVAASLVFGFMDKGCEGPAYSPIVGAGPTGRSCITCERAAHGWWRTGGHRCGGPMRRLRERHHPQLPVGGKFRRASARFIRLFWARRRRPSQR